MAEVFQEYGLKLFDSFQLAFSIRHKIIPLRRYYGLAVISSTPPTMEKHSEIFSSENVFKIDPLK